MAVKTILFEGKCCDSFYAVLRDSEGQLVGEYDGYVPSFLGGSDNVRLKIDLQTGQILNWTPPTEEEIAALLRSDSVLG